MTRTEAAAARAAAGRLSTTPTGSASVTGAAANGAAAGGGAAAGVPGGVAAAGDGRLRSRRRLRDAISSTPPAPVGLTSPAGASGRLSSYCTAAAFDIPAMYRHMRAKGGGPAAPDAPPLASAVDGDDAVAGGGDGGANGADTDSQAVGNVEDAVEVIDSVLHVRRGATGTDAFFFPFGATVLWGYATPAAEAIVLSELRSFETADVEGGPGGRPGTAGGADGGGVDGGSGGGGGGAATRQEDVFTFAYGEATQTKMVHDRVELTRPVGRESMLERLSVSYALAQSVKLASFEARVAATVAETAALPEALARTGAIGVSRLDVSRSLGRLFLLRHAISLSDVLDEPDFFWDNEAYAPAYAAACRYLECTARAGAVDKRLAMVRSLYDLLLAQTEFDLAAVGAEHSSRLEIIIIALIAFEILLSLARDGVFAAVAAAAGRLLAPAPAAAAALTAASSGTAASGAGASVGGTGVLPATVVARVAAAPGVAPPAVVAAALLTALAVGSVAAWLARRRQRRRRTSHSTGVPPAGNL